MKHFSFLTGLALAALTLMAADKAAHADKRVHTCKPAHASKPAHPCKSAHTHKPPHTRARPFVASGSGFRAGSRLYASDISAMPLGHNTSLVVSFDESLLDDLWAFLPDTGAFPPGVLTAANGDELVFYFDEELYFLDPDTLIVYTTVTFTGGTGRFQAASGSAAMMIDFDDSFLFQTFSFLIDGSIDH